MDISVRNFRRIERADLTGGPIILLAGPNNQGKSSTLTAAALGLTRQKTTKSGRSGPAPEMVRRGFDEAEISVTGENGRVDIVLPAGTVTEHQRAPMSSAIAAGLVQVTAMDANELAGALGYVIKSEPTRDDLDAALKDLGISEKVSASIWDKIVKDGWDNAHAQAKETGAKFKGRWEQVSGQKKWGVKLADGWRPDGWKPTYAEMTVEEADNTIAERAKALEDAISGRAIDTDRIAQIETELAEIGEITSEEVYELQEAVPVAEKALAEAEKARHACLVPDQDEGQPCPHCGAMVAITPKGKAGFTLAAVGTEHLSEDEIKKRRLAIAGADGAVEHAKTGLADARIKATAAEARRQKHLDLAAKLEELRGTGKPDGEASDEDEIAAARAALAEAHAVKAMIEQVATTDRLHGSIVANQAIVAELDRDGLRRTVLARALTDFNENELRPICDAGKWPAIEVRPDMSIAFGGFAVTDLGRSSRWIAEAILRIAIAGLDGSDVVVFDEADALDQFNRNALFKLLRDRGVTAIVGMTVSKVDLVPDLADKGGIGVSYWVQDGIVRPLAEAQG